MLNYYRMPKEPGLFSPKVTITGKRVDVNKTSPTNAVSGYSSSSSPKNVKSSSPKQGKRIPKTLMTVGGKKKK